MWPEGIVVSGLFHRRKHTKVDSAAASQCYNQYIAKTGIVISEFDCMYYEGTGSEQTEDGDDGL